MNGSFSTPNANFAVMVAEQHIRRLGLKMASRDFPEVRRKATHRMMELIVGFALGAAAGCGRPDGVSMAKPATQELSAAAQPSGSTVEPVAAGDQPKITDPYNLYQSGPADSCGLPPPSGNAKLLFRLFVNDDEHTLRKHLEVHKGDINGLVDRDSRALALAAQLGATKSVLRLLKAGADANGRTFEDQTPLSMAAANCRVTIARYLLRHGAIVDSRNSDGTTPLMEAVKAAVAGSNPVEDCIATANMLLAAGADPLARNILYDNVSYFIAGPIPLNEDRSLKAIGALGRAIRKSLARPKKSISRVESSRRRVELAPAHVVWPCGEKLFYRAVFEDDPDLIEQLLNHRPDLVGSDFEGRPPLLLAAATGANMAAEILVRRHAPVNAVDAIHGETALLAAAGACHKPEIVRLLAENGADPNLRSTTGETPLMAAARAGCLANTLILMAIKARLDFQDEDGSTALMLAEGIAEAETASPSLEPLSVMFDPAGVAELLRRASAAK